MMSFSMDKKKSTVIDELFPVHASSHINFCGNSLIHGDPLKEASPEIQEGFSSYFDGIK